MAEQPERPSGRPTKFTPELGRSICARVELVGFEAVAAEGVGVHRHTLRNWRVRGDAGDPEFAEFALDLARAKATFAERQLQKVDDPRWLLERLDPEVFSTPRRHELTGVNGSAVAVEHKHTHSLSRDQSVEIVSRILGVQRELVETKFRAPPQLEADSADGDAV